MDAPETGVQSISYKENGILKLNTTSVSNQASKHATVATLGSGRGCIRLPKGKLQKLSILFQKSTPKTLLAKGKTIFGEGVHKLCTLLPKGFLKNYMFFSCFLRKSSAVKCKLNFNFMHPQFLEGNL